MFQYIECKPHPKLSGLVKCYWYLEKDYSIATRETIFPDTCVDLIIYSGSPFQNVPMHGFFIGQLKQSLNLVSTGLTRSAGIRFYPFGAYPFFKLPMKKLAGRQIALSDLMCVDVIENLAWISPQQAFIEFETLLFKLLNPERLDIAPIISAVHMLYDQHGTIRISDLAASVNLSKRSLERQFVETIGISPKLLARIMRFNHVKNDLILNPETKLTDMGFRHNYFDQAHFIHEFKEFSGDQPSVFRDRVISGEISFYK